MASFRPGDIDLPAKRIVRFDDSASPPWIMVPVGEFRRVILSGGVGLSLQLKPVWDPNGKGVVTITEQSAPGAAERPIVLTAAAPGTTVLEARNANGLVQASLEITVKEQVKLATFVHFVLRPRNWTNHALSRPLSRVELIRRHTNSDC